MIEGILMWLLQLVTPSYQPTVLATTTIMTPIPTPTVGTDRDLSLPPTINALPPTPTIKPTKTPRPTRTPKPTRKPTPTAGTDLTPTIGTGRDLSLLINEMNKYRKEENKSAISSHPLLCRIANERVQALVNRGSLDNHEGIRAYEQEIFSAFNKWWEVIFFASPAKTTNQVVWEGWAKSSSHNQSILADEATHGCGAEKNGYAIFILGEQ